MYVGEDVTREEALKTAEGIRLTPAENEKDSTPALAWSDYAASVIENEELSESDESGMCLTVPKERMENVHKIGDAFSPLDTELAAGLKIKVTDVQIADDVSLLNPRGRPGPPSVGGNLGGYEDIIGQHHTLVNQIPSVNQLQSRDTHPQHHGHFLPRRSC